MSFDNQTTGSQKIELNLEGLRGFAAAVVIIHHALKLEFTIDPGFSPDTNWINALSAHSSVLIFFILSGYVIGLTNPNGLTWGDAIPYLRKRLVRLYPIYIISLVITLIALTHDYSIWTILGHFFFLQNIAVPVIWENNPLWSLNYEVLYYLAFIPIACLRIRTGRACIVAAISGLIYSTLLPVPLISSYCFGFVFWGSGLWLARNQFFTRQHSSRQLLFALMCIFISHESLSPIPTSVLVLDTKFHFLSHFVSARIPFGDLYVELPFCFYLFLRFTNRTIKSSQVFLFIYVASFFIYYLHIINKYGLYSHGPYQAFYLLVPIIFLLVGTILLVISEIKSPPTKVISLPTPLLNLGAISYAIYVIHFPIGILLARITFFSGSALSFSVRLIIDLLLVLTIGYFLELKVQPWFKTRFSSKPVSRSAISISTT